VQGTTDEKIFYRLDVIEVHNGVVGYNSVTQELIVNNDDSRFLRTNNGNKRRDAVDVLSAPKLNGCHFVLIKSKITPHLFAMAHISPTDDFRQMYQELLQKFPSGDELNVVLCGGYSGDINSLAQLSVNQGCKLSSVRQIPFNFDVETFVVSGEPKSVYFYFIPSEDELIIYSDAYKSYLSKSTPAIHIGTNIFKDVANPIEFHLLNQCIRKELTDDGVLSSSSEFERTFLPVLTEKFLSDYPSSRVYTYQKIPDQYAKVFGTQKLAAIAVKADFKTTAVELPALDNVQSQNPTQSTTSVEIATNQLQAHQALQKKELQELRQPVANVTPPGQDRTTP
jgi:hypothetical protein